MVEFRGMIWPEMVVKRRRRSRGRIVISLLTGHVIGNCGVEMMMMLVR